ncbi:hypothetical protein GPECTOR_34g716 [Gonium pectorale]|uniref:STAS domain-containing protein n=1 Tax=Gonium pectorale TaxID=33097 RepID=A0A150GCI4_GONPE|nr:hypothetical protein GPECTOR_34g716 [Gonium pectorale]|eukprot:KXZ47557.1 hypothetical protein GPECTOR_34g716 [Gonium pectorale]
MPRRSPKLRGGKLVPSPSFLDDVLFASGVDTDTSLVVLSSRGSETCRAAAKALASLGKHDIYTVEGGFRGWQAAGLDIDTSTLASGESESDYYGELYDTSAVRDAATRGGVEEVLLDSARARGPLDALLRVPFKPKLLDVLRQGYTMADLQRDVVAGTVVGVIALALGMALGIASDSTPAVGVYTVVVGGLLASLLSGSRVTVVGPTAAFIPIVAGVAHDHGVAGLVACTGLAGLMLMAMGASGMGGIIRYVPKPVVTGFTAGIATYIFGTQIKDFLGLGAPGRLPEGVPIPTEFLEKVVYLGSHLDTAHVPSIAMGIGCLVLLKTWPKEWAKVVPPPILAIAAGTLGLQLFSALQPGTDLGIETIGSHFGAGAIPRSLPSLHWPEGFDPADLPSLVYPAATIAMLAAIESLLCARVADGMINDKHDSNTELISQGVANLACAAFGCLPATGALARTAANIRAGGRSPVSGIVHALTVAAVVLAAAPYAEYIPLPALSAVLVVVAINMGEWHNFEHLPKWPKNDAQLFLIAFSLTVLQDVAVAVAFGMVIALAVFVQDVSSTMHVRALPPRAVITPPDHDPAAGLLDVDADDEPYRRTSAVLTSTGSSVGNDGDDDEPVEGPPLATPVMAGSATRGVLAAGTLRCVVPQGTVYVEVTGSLLFGAGEMLERAVEATHSQDPIQVLVLNMSHVNVVDVSGLEVLEEALRRLDEDGKMLVLCGLTRQPLRMMARAGFLDQVGRENVCRNVEAALARASAIVTSRHSELKGAALAVAAAGSPIREHAHTFDMAGGGNRQVDGYTPAALASDDLGDMWVAAAVPRDLHEMASSSRLGHDGIVSARTLMQRSGSSGSAGGTALHQGGARGPSGGSIMDTDLYARENGSA